VSRAGEGRTTSVVVCQANLTAADVESMNVLRDREVSLCYRHVRPSNQLFSVGNVQSPRSAGAVFDRRVAVCMAHAATDVLAFVVAGVRRGSRTHALGPYQRRSQRNAKPIIDHASSIR
jgi:hypothetical protein